MLEELAEQIQLRTAKGLAQAVSGMVSTGQLEPGSRLPTVRAVARRLGVSPSTVSEAWQLLAGRGLVQTAGRRGSFIRDSPPPQSQRRFRHVTGSDLPLDLSTGYPDPDLLPDIRPFLARLAEGPAFTGYPDHEIDPALADLLQDTVPPSCRQASGQPGPPAAHADQFRRRDRGEWRTGGVCAPTAALLGRARHSWGAGPLEGWLQPVGASGIGERGPHEPRRTRHQRGPGVGVCGRCRARRSYPAVSRKPA